jgi:polyisoprenoid-binding protein YceI
MNKLILVSFLFLISNTTYSQTMSRSIKIDKSNVKWYGDEITGKQHYGSLKFKEGKVILTGTGKVSDKIISGNFIVDMTSLSVEDLTGRGKNSLEGHLKSDDFFSVGKYNYAFLKILDGNDPIDGIQTLNGDLTIKGISNPVKFTMELNGKKAKCILIFDRTKYDVKFRSGNFFQNLGDKLIYDDIKLEVSLEFE